MVEFESPEVSLLQASSRTDVLVLCARTGAATGYPAQGSYTGAGQGSYTGPGQGSYSAGPAGYPPYGQQQYGQQGYGQQPHGQYPPYGGAQYPPYGGQQYPAYGGYPPAGAGVDPSCFVTRVMPVLSFRADA
jgi:hypothetical protein